MPLFNNYIVCLGNLSILLVLWLAVCLVLLQQLWINLPSSFLPSVIHLDHLDRHYLLLLIAVVREIIGSGSSITCRCIELFVQSAHFDISPGCHALPTRLVILQRLREQVAGLVGQSVAIWACITMVMSYALIVSVSATALCLRDGWDFRHRSAIVISFRQRLSGLEEPWWVVLWEQGWLPTILGSRHFDEILIECHRSGATRTILYSHWNITISSLGRAVYEFLLSRPW